MAGKVPVEAVEAPAGDRLPAGASCVEAGGRWIMGWFDEAGNGDPVDVAALLDSRVPVLVGGIVGAGALVSIGTTSDGGALGITVTLDGRWRREYFRDSEAATEWLEQALQAVLAEFRDSPASSGRRKRSRRS